MSVRSPLEHNEGDEIAHDPTDYMLIYYDGPSPLMSLLAHDVLSIIQFTSPVPLTWISGPPGHRNHIGGLG